MDFFLRLIFGLIFIFFSVGIYRFSDKFLNFLKNNISKKNQYFYSKSLIYFLTLSIFSIVSNGILLLVPLLGYTAFFDLNSIIIIQTICNIILLLIVIFIVFYGFKYINKISKKGLISFKDININSILKENNLTKLNNNLTIYFLILPILIYVIFFPPSLLNLIGDTGLYHLPYVNHLASFGIEKGLVNLSLKYPFYNLTLYGQVPFQFLYGIIRDLIPGTTNQVISPSMNILYFSGFLFYIKENLIEKKTNINENYYLDQKIPAEIEKKSFSQIKLSSFQKKYTDLSYHLLIFSFIPLTGFNFKYSLFSYNIDLVLTILTLVLIHSISKSVILNKYDLGAFLLIPLLPVFKLSGIVSVLYILIIFFSIKFKLKKEKIFSIASLSLFLKQNKTYTLFALILVLIPSIFFLLTSYIQTGYLIYPSTIFGPLGDQGLTLDQMKIWEEEIINFSRFMSTNLRIQNARYVDWLPFFLKSKVGIVSLIIFIYSIFNYLTNLQKKNSPISIISFSYSTANIITIISIILFFPPDLRFYSWLIAITFFLFTINYSTLIVNILKNSISSLFLAIFIFFLSGPFLILVGFRLPNVINMKKGTDIYNIQYSFSEKWEHRSKSYLNKEIPIKIPTYQLRCWNIEPPCTLKGESYLRFKH